MEIQSHRYSYYKDEDICFEYEVDGLALCMHCTVFRFTPSVMKLLYSLFATFKSEAAGEGISKIYTITPNPRFASMFGGASLHAFTHEGVGYEVIQWILK